MRESDRGAYYCPNCDQVQPQEAMLMERRKTKEDIRFQMYWLREFSLYEDNTKKDVGNPNSEGAPNE
jgi:hypothetical protein